MRIGEFLNTEATCGKQSVHFLAVRYHMGYDGISRISVAFVDGLAAREMIDPEPASRFHNTVYFGESFMPVTKVWKYLETEHNVKIFIVYRY